MPLKTLSKSKRPPKVFHPTQLHPAERVLLRRGNRNYTGKADNHRWNRPEKGFAARTSSYRGPALEYSLEKRLGIDLHGSAIQHAEHIRIGRGASVAVVDEVVDAHTRPATRLRGWWRRSRAFATCRGSVQSAVGLWSRSEVRWGGTRSRGRLRVRRGRSATRVIRVCTLRRCSTRRLRSVVRLSRWGPRWSRRIRCRRARWRRSAS
jgi:hypothetical protein